MRRTLVLLLVLAIMPISGIFAEDAKTLLTQGDALQKESKFAEAVKAYDKAIELDPKYVDAYVKRGQCKRSLNPPDYKGSIADFNKAIELDPKSYTAYNSRGITYKDMKDYDRAQADYGKAIQIDPKNYKAFYNRGFLNLIQKDYKGAEADYSKAIECDSSYTFNYSQRARARQALGNKEGALADYDKAIALTAKNVDAFYYRSTLKQEMGDTQGALADARKALELSPNSDLYKGQLDKLTGDKSAVSPSTGSTSSPQAGSGQASQPPAVSASSVPISFFPDKPDDVSIWNNPDTPWVKGDILVTGNFTPAEMAADIDFSTLDFDEYQSAVMSKGQRSGEVLPESEGGAG